MTQTWVTALPISASTHHELHNGGSQQCNWSQEAFDSESSTPSHQHTLPEFLIPLSYKHLY